MSTTVKEIRRSAFKIVMSTGDSIPIDPEEVDAVYRGLEQGSLIRVKQGIVNPSFLVSIVKDKERIDRFIDDTRHDSPKRAKGLEPLKDLFADGCVKLPSGKEMIGS